MRKIDFKALRPEQIEVRPTDTGTKGKATLLLYIDSRSAVDILNDTFGPFGWMIEYKAVGDQIYGRLSIWDEEKNMWIAKEDTGSESNIEGGKGQSSDILKRCLSRLGCDFLYHTPKVKINCPDNYYFKTKDRNGNEVERLTMTFQVKEIEWDENKNCKKLIIADKWGKVVYEYQEGNEVVKNEPKMAENGKIEKKDNLQILRDFCKERIKDEPRWKKDIENFGLLYSKKCNEWKGTFMVDKLYDKWVKNRKVS